MRIIAAILIVLSSFSLFGAADCSAMSWETADGDHHFLGRTYDFFGGLEANGIAAVRPGYDIALDLEGRNTVEAEYGYAGMAILGFPSPIMVDGMNEKGLAGALLNFPGYAHFNTQEGLDVHPAFLLTYLLGTCSSVEEAAQRIKEINLTDELIMGSRMETHYILSDTTGETIIIEPEEDGIRVFRNTIGIMTNAPGYEWHLTNLKGYVGLSNLHTPPRDILGLEVSAFGQGTGGLFGLPGTYSSPDRFVRMAFVKEYSPKGETELEAVSRMFRCFSPVTIPDGMLKEVPDEEIYEETLCTTVMSLDSGIYYFSPFTNRRISAIDVPKYVSGMDADFEVIEIPRTEDIDYLN